MDNKMTNAVKEDESDDNKMKEIKCQTEDQDELSDLVSLPSITHTNDDYFKWVKAGLNNQIQSSNSTTLINLKQQLSPNNALSRSDTMTTSYTFGSVGQAVKNNHNNDKNQASTNDSECNMNKSREIEIEFEPDMDTKSATSDAEIEKLDLNNTADTSSDENFKFSRIYSEEFKKILKRHDDTLIEMANYNSDSTLEAPTYVDHFLT